MRQRHRIVASWATVTAVRERIERRLNVETTAQEEAHGWAVYFTTSRKLRDEDLDFLRPDVLPPRVERTADDCEAATRWTP